MNEQDYHKSIVWDQSDANLLNVKCGLIWWGVSEEANDSTAPAAAPAAAVKAVVLRAVVKGSLTLNEAAKNPQNLSS